MRLLLAKGARVVRANPKRTRVAKCVRKVKRRQSAARAAHRKTVRSAYAVCTRATGQSYRTGRRINAKRKRPARAREPFEVYMGARFVAGFAKRRDAVQYAHSLAHYSGRQVAVKATR